jgi:hypothetical protein
MRRTILILLILAITTISGYAQPGDFRGKKGRMPAERRQHLQERIETMRIWKLTELLNLDESKALKFFPRYKVFNTELDSINNQFHEIKIQLDEKLESDSETGYTNLVSELKTLSLAKSEITFEFVESVSDILSEREKVQLLIFQQEFGRRIREMVREIQEEEGPPPMDQRRGNKRKPFGG